MVYLIVCLLSVYSCAHLQSGQLTGVGFLFLLLGPMDSTQFVSVVSNHLYLPGHLSVFSLFFYLFVCLFETRSHCVVLAETHYVDQAGFKLRDPLCISIAKIKGMHHHSWACNLHFKPKYMRNTSINVI